MSNNPNIPSDSDFNPQNPSNNLGGTSQYPVSKSDLKSASKQLMTNLNEEKKKEEKVNPTPQNKKNNKDKTPQNQKEKNKKNKKLVFFMIFLAILLIPMPKQVGGDVEISGAPTVNQALIRPTVNGTLREIFIKSGQKVTAGETIASLRNWEIEEKILEGEKQLARLSNSARALNAQVQVAQEEYARSNEEYKRQKAESSFIQRQAKALESEDGINAPRIQSTRKQLEQIKLQAESLSQRAALHKYLSEEGVYPRQSALQSAYEAASAAKQSEALSAQLKAEEAELKESAIENTIKLNEVRRSAQANLQRLNATKQELFVNNAQLGEAKKQLEIYRKQKEELILKSPIDGTVLTLKTDLLLGQNFNKGDTIAVIGNLKKVSVTLQLPEEDRAFVKKEQEVTARIRAIPDEVFKGTVDEIAPVTSETGEETSARRIWDINMVLKNNQGSLRPGMTGYAKIHTGHWRPLLFLAWDELYKAFRLDRYMDRNPLAFLSLKGNV
ncbi:MAG: efflux RND transporter periplasmic adaptor subunit [Candidatus Caenarcaniphilales bacterium]|nr:efflux RND transporter periplasmic adaptor subunit [Candidatus Caenarcaniphilales bacterium]